jgi:periodic tryptophan protein 1
MYRASVYNGVVATLCLRTISDTSSVASYVAVATFHPSIEIWNLDVIDPLEPSAVLGGFVDHTGVSGGDTGAKKTGKKKKKAKAQLRSKAPALKPGSHCGAVLSVAWNRIFRQLLASGSDDNTVKLWDVHTQQCLHTYTHHSQPVRVLVHGFMDRSRDFYRA